MASHARIPNITTTTTSIRLLHPNWIRHLPRTTITTPRARSAFLTDAQYPITTSFSRRPFSSSRPSPASVPRPKQPSQPSMRAQLARQQADFQRSGAVLDYVGLLDGTLIMPRSGSPFLPSWTTSPRARFALEWRRARTRLVEFLQGFVSAKFLVRPRVSVWRGRRDATVFAREIYEAMNLGLASGELRTVEGKLAPGLVESLRARVAGRAAGVGFVWKVEKWVERPEVVSWRFMLLPAPSGEKVGKRERHGILQCVVRLRSRQSLLRTRKTRSKDRKGVAVVQEVVVDAEGREIRSEEEVEMERKRSEKETVEYLVVQRLLKKGKMEPWTAWGTAEETGLDHLRRDEQKLQQQALSYKA